ncbi:hypothetical protein MKX03_034463, partial [Papaver bracteatum]
MELACMPENFVEDAIELLIFASRIPRAMDGFMLDDLRAKMIKVLFCWMPERSGSSSIASPFEGHQFAVEYPVRNILKLYIDIEFTGSHTQNRLLCYPSGRSGHSSTYFRTDYSAFSSSRDGAVSEGNYIIICKSNGSLLIETSGGLNQQRMGVALDYIGKRGSTVGVTREKRI